MNTRAILGNLNAADHLRRVRELSRAMRDAGEDMRAEVEWARQAGASWQAIADAVGPSPHRPEGSSPTAIRRFYDPEAR